jgi:hypothetical protein
VKKHEEQLIREYVRAHLRDHTLNEGVSDIFRKGAEAALAKITKLMDTLKSMTATSDAVVSVLEKNDGADAVAKVDAMGEKFESSISAADKAVPSPKKESLAYKNYQRLVSESKRADTVRRPLNEVGVFESVGLVLAAIGGVPLILKAAYKLASWMKFEKAAEKLKSAYEAAHHFEEKVIDVIIPDKAIYAVYVMFEEKSSPDRVANLKLYSDDPEVKLDGDRSMTLDEFKKSDTKKKYEKRVYALILLPWLISGLTSIHHMLHSWISAVEGAATAEKAMFVGARAADVVRKISGEFVAATAAAAETV